MRRLGTVALILVVGGLLALWRLSGSGPLDHWILGLPAALGVMVWGLAVATLLILGFLYALSFPRWRPGDERVEELRELAQRQSRRAGEGDG